MFLVGGHRYGAEAWVRAARLWAGPSSPVGGPAAAYWHGPLTRPHRGVDVAARPGCRRRPPPGVAARRRGVGAPNDPARFRADRRKGNDLVAAGWVLLRFTWHDVTDRPEATVARIREGRAARRPAGPSRTGRLTGL